MLLSLLDHFQGALRQVCVYETSEIIVNGYVLIAYTV